MMLHDMKINILIVPRLKSSFKKSFLSVLMSTRKMFTLLVTPRHKNIKNWALPDPPELIICMRGFFDMAKKTLIVPRPKKPPTN